MNLQSLSNIHPQVPPMDYKCAVMVNTAAYQGALRKMTDVIHGVVLQSGKVPVDELDDLGTMMVLQDSLNHYLEFILSKAQTGNIGIDYFIQEYFPRYAPYLLENRSAVDFLGHEFAVLAGQLAHHLQPAMEQIEHAGQQIEHIETFTVDAGKLQLYVLEGSHWDEDTPA